MKAKADRKNRHRTPELYRRRKKPKADRKNHHRMRVRKDGCTIRRSANVRKLRRHTKALDVR
jgi:hypothetical protein